MESDLLREILGEGYRTGSLEEDPVVREIVRWALNKAGPDVLMAVTTYWDLETGRRRPQMTIKLAAFSLGVSARVLRQYLEVAKGVARNQLTHSAGPATRSKLSEYKN
jgi:hypothetical protein